MGEKIVIGIFVLFSSVAFLFGQSNIESNEEWIIKEDSIKSKYNSFSILLIVNGKYRSIDKLYTYKNNIKKECYIVWKCLDMLYISKEDYMNIRTSDSLIVQFSHCVSTNHNPILSFSLSNDLYYSHGGPIVYIYTSDDRKNKNIVRKRKGFLDYCVFAEYHNYATTLTYANYSIEYEW